MESELPYLYRLGVINLLLTEFFVGVNLVHVLVAAVANMAIGMIWYSKFLFGKPWMKLVGKTQKDLKKRKPVFVYLLNFAGSFVLALVLGRLFQGMGMFAPVADILTLAAILWAGFVVTTNLPDYLFSGRNLKIYLISMGYHLVSILAMSLILAMWV